MTPPHPLQRTSSRRRLARLGLLLGFAAACAAAPQPLAPAETARLGSYLDQHAQTPEDYILGKFQRCDVVLLAEDHAIRHNLLLAQRLIPLLHRAGVHNFGMEFGASEDQARLDALVTAERYDEDLARKLMFNYNVGWAYREYMDIYRAAWALNRSLPPGSRKFRILNLSYQYDYAGYNGVRTPTTLAGVFHKGGTEAYRAEVVRREILAKREKLLVLTGTVHAFTRYAFPMEDYNSEGFYRLEDRHMGNRLLKLAPGRVCTILLHQPFFGQRGGQCYPADGAIDQIMAARPGRRAGFDLAGSPLGDLPDHSFYAIGHPDFRMRDLADGYVYEMPFADYAGCTVDEKFLTAENWPEARRQLPDFPAMNPKPETPEQYLEKIRAYADLPQRYRGLQ